MTLVTASAPGKLVISGEYAVLDGATAIAAAVNTRARVAIRDSEKPTHLVSSRGALSRQGRFRSENGDIEWLDADTSFGIVDHAWRVAGADIRRPVSISLDTRAFFAEAGQTKLGLGSSAALVTALTAALHAFSGVEADVTETALQAHRRFQQGEGSGVDVVCSSSGGLISFQIDNAQPQSLAWPQDLQYAVFWSGVPASTTARLHALSQRLAKQSRTELAAAAERVAQAWSAGSAAALMDALHDYVEHLRRFSIDHDLGIFDAGHARLITGQNEPVVYKPCGAGGGDVGIALATNADALAAFIERATNANFVQLDVAIDPQGYRVAREDD